MTQQELEEKIAYSYKYLFIDYFRDKFNVENFGCNINDMDEENIIHEMEIYVTLDNLDFSGDGTPKGWANLMKKTDELIIDFLYEYSYDNQNHKILKNKDVKNYVHEGVFFECHLKWDELHKFNISYLIRYD